MFAPPNEYIPQCTANSGPKLVWLLACSFAILLVSMILAAPLALANGQAMFGLIIYQAFSYVCHQMPGRSLFIAGHPLAVCSRCAGIYIGFTVAVLLYPRLKSLKDVETPQRKWLVMAALPLALDFTLGFLGIWQNTHFSRFATGALLGAVAVFYVMPALADLALRWRSHAARTVAKTPVQS